jgi:hypothetical protein
MRFRSLLAVLILGIAGFGFVGCGASGTGTDFVATGNKQVPTTGNLLFRFVTAQVAFTVPDGATTLKFEFFDGGASADSIYTSNKPFAPEITVENVPVTASTVVITGFDGNGIPLYTITQSIAVVGGTDTVIDGINGPVAVTLDQIRPAPGTVNNADQTLTSLTVSVGGKVQMFLYADYNNGTSVLLGTLADYQIVAGEVFASVDPTALVSGLAAGTATLEASYGGQTVQLPVFVTVGAPVEYSGITVTNTPVPVVVPNGTPVQLNVSGNLAPNTLIVLSPTDPALAYSIDPANPDFTVDTNTGIVSTTVDAGSATVKVDYTNFNNVVVSTTVAVEAAAAAP